MRDITQGQFAGVGVDLGRADVAVVILCDQKAVETSMKNAFSAGSTKNTPDARCLFALQKIVS
jgi:hypothetical protein